ncbi:MAG: hypothetical protein ACYTAO_11295 [Planctomycetota bacterium]
MGFIFQFNEGEPHNKRIKIDSLIARDLSAALAYILGGDMRICIILMILLALSGCSPKTPTEHHILPVGFSGVYKIERAHGPSGGYKIEGNRHIFTIPENGILCVESDVFETHCLQCNNRLSVTFEDGQEIPLFGSRQPVSAPNSPLWLGLIRFRNAIWCAVGTHDQLSRFLEQVRAEMYQNLERYLPPNMPFQTQGELSKEARGKGKSGDILLDSLVRISVNRC